MFEVANGTGAHSKRYADAVAFGLWPSHGHKIEGIEIKVSRSDFLSEMKKPQKSAPVYQYCHHWWLAVPKGLVDKAELPPTWGLLELTGDRLVAKVKAPLLTPEPATPAFVAALLRRHAGRDEDMSNAHIAKEVERRMVAHRDRLDREHRDRIANHKYSVARAEKELADFKERTGIDLTTYAFDGAKAAHAFSLLMQLNSGYDSLATIRRHMQGVIEQIDSSGVLMENNDG